jgi:hypothetical protein
MAKVLVFLILIVVLTTAGLAVSNAAMSHYLTAFIALAALVVSVLSAFKEDVFPFRPRALFGEVILAGHGPSAPDSPTLLVPIVFVNEGYGAGVIEGLTFKVVSGATTKIYMPVLEIDVPKFWSGKRAIHAENILGTFNSFPIGSRQVISKSVTFIQVPDSPRYPFSNWAEGEYEFHLYMKHTGANTPVKVATVTRTIEAKTLAEYMAGVASTSISPNRELGV